MKTISRFAAAICAAAFLCASASAQTTVNITATDAAAAETIAGQPPNPGNIRISRTGATTSALTVYIKSISGTALRGTDYNFGRTVGTSIVIPIGSASVDLPVNVTDDFLTEGSETVRIDLDSETPAGAALPYGLGTDRAIVTIADNEDPLAPPRPIVTVAVIDAVGTETANGSDPAVFRISRSNNLAPALRVLFSLGGTATAGVAYTAVPLEVTIPAGATFADVTIAPIDDPQIEPQQSVTLTINPTDIVTVPAPAEAYAIGTPSTASVAIVSDDLPPPPVVAITAPGPNAASASGQPLTVRFTASAVDGYIASYTVLVSGSVAASGTTNLPANTPAGTPYEGTASVTLNGANAFAQIAVSVTNNNGVSATTAPVPVYLFNAPPPPPPPPPRPVINIYALDGQGTEVRSESPDVATFRVTHSFPASATVSFLYAIGGTAKRTLDYTVSSTGTFADSFLGSWFTFPAGTTEAVITVTPVDDELIEGAETVTLSLYTPPFIGFNEGGPQGYDPGTFGFYYGPNSSASVSILSDDVDPPPFPLVTIAATDPVGTETTDDSDPLVFTITRESGPTTAPLVVNYTLTIPPKQTIYVTEPRPAMGQNGVDFATLTGSATIPAGASSVEIRVLPTFDLLAEPMETLQLTLRPSAVAWPTEGGYVLDDHTVATATIQDATLLPGTPVVRVVSSDSQAYEGAAPSRTASFTVSRTGDLAAAIPVAYTLGGTATNGVDYLTLPGSVVIPAGLASATIVVDPLDDAIEENIESVSLTLQPPPLGSGPAPYALSGLANGQRSAAASLRDVYVRPLTRFERARLIRFGRTSIIPRPSLPNTTTTAGAAALPAAEPTSWTVEASTDLVTWEEIGTVESSEEIDEFVDVNAGDFTARFYRFRAITP